METDGLPPRWSEYARRLPSSLEDPKGPVAGKIELPLHVAWSGRRIYDVGDSEDRPHARREWEQTLITTALW